MRSLRSLFGISFLVFNSVFAFAQSNSVVDTTKVPVYAEMMQNRQINFYATQRAFELYWQNREITKGSGWKPYKRWEWVAQQMIDNQGRFPNEDLLPVEIEKLRNNTNIGTFSQKTNCRLEGNWKELGPVYLPQNNTSQINGMGRLNAVTIHPKDTNIIFVGACAGGIWKTINGGITWTNYRDSLPTLGVSAIAINPNHPDTMYFGSGDRDAGDALGYGVFKSVDAGNSWTIHNSGMGNVTVGKLVIDPKQNNTLLAASSNGIYRSTNGASSWTRVSTLTNFIDIAFMPGNSQIAYASRAGFFYRSSNNGQSWTQITNGLPTTDVSRAVLAVSPLDSLLVYVWIANGSVHKGLYLSKDGGQTFRTMSTTPNIHSNAIDGSGTSGQGWYNKTMVIDPENAGIVYCGGVNIFKSNDSGKTWVQAGYWVNQVHADQHDMIACYQTKRVFVANDGGLYFTRNKGVPWIPIKSGLAIAQIYNIGASRTQKDILIAGFQDNGTGNFRDNQWFTSRGGDGMTSQVDQEDNRYSYGELYYGRIFRVFNASTQTDIAGENINGINESGAWNTPFCLQEGQSNTMFVGYKNIWRSTNIRSSPPSWTKISNDLGGISNINFHKLENCIANNAVLYASRANNTFFITTNALASSPTWTQLSTPINGLVRAIETDPQSQQIVYIGIENRVYKSLNQGQSWTQIHSNLPANVTALVLDTSSTLKGLYVGTFGGGLWYTDSLQNGWKYYANGIPPTSRITDLAIYYDTTKECNCSVVYASTYNRGAWYTSLYQDSAKRPIIQSVEIPSLVYCQNSSIKPKIKTCNVPTVFKWVFDKSVQFVNGTDSSFEFPEFLCINRGKYNYLFIVENCVGADTFRGTFEYIDTLPPTCINSTVNTNQNFGIGIFEFSLNNKSIFSVGTFNEGAYLDQTCTEIFKLKTNSSYPVYTRTGTGNDEQVAIHLDRNNDGVLSGTNELISLKNRNRTHHRDTIFIDRNIKTYTPLRLRVRSDFWNISTGPCDTLNYGQTEDYVVYIERDSFFPDFSSNKSALCVGESAVFTYTGLYAELPPSWDFGPLASPRFAEGVGPHTINFIQSGTVHVRLDIGNETLLKNNIVNVKPSPKPQISFISGGNTVCVGSPLVLQVQDNLQLNPTYQWFRNQQILTDSTFRFLRYNQTNLQNTGTYQVKATASGCTDSVFISVLIHPKPIVDFSVNNNSQCFRGHQIVVNNNSTINTGSLQWFWNMGNGINSNDKDPVFSYSQAGSYTLGLTAVSMNGCVDSLKRNLHVRPQAIADFQMQVSETCLKDNQIEFTNKSTVSTGTLQYSWHFGDNTGSTLSDPKKTYTYADTFECTLIVSTPYQCNDTAKQILIIHPQPLFDLVIPDTSACFNEHSIYVSTVHDSTYSYNYRWDWGDGNSSFQKNESKKYASPGFYTIQLEAGTAFGCKDIKMQTVSIHPNPELTLKIPDEACLMDSLFFTITEQKYSDYLQWYLNDVGVSTAPTFYFIPSMEGILNLRLLSSNLSCSTSYQKDIIIRPLPLFSIGDDSSFCENTIFEKEITNPLPHLKALWENGDTTASRTIKEEGVYTLTLTDQNKCKYTDTIQIRTIPHLRVSLGEDILLNPSLPIHQILNTYGKYQHYLWNTGDTSAYIIVNKAGIYSLIAIDSMSCSSSDTIEVRYWNRELFVPTFSGMNTELQIIAYPNPSDANLYIAFNKELTFSIMLYDSKGKKVGIYEGEGQLTTIETAHLSSGIYTLKVLSSMGNKTEKVIILH